MLLLWQAIIICPSIFLSTCDKHPHAHQNQMHAAWSPPLRGAIAIRKEPDSRVVGTSAFGNNE
jgi:hypothetical protein